MTGLGTSTWAPGRVLLVDDHRAMRSVLRSLLEEVGWQVVGEAADGEQAVELVGSTTPDVVLMDCKMPGGGGVAATRVITERYPRVAVIAHTAYADESYVREMVAAGARGYVLKGDAPQVVLEALEAARVGAARLSAGVTGPALTDLRGLYEAALARSEQLSEENAALAAAVTRLRAEDQARDDFLSLVGHELRTPVTVLMGIAATLDARPEVAAGPDGVELIARLVAQSRRLASVVDQLLAAGAFAAGRSPALRSEPVELGAVLERAASVVRSRRPELRVELAVPPGCRPVAADQGALVAAIERLADGLAAQGVETIRLRVAQPPGWTRIDVVEVGTPDPAGNHAARDVAGGGQAGPGGATAGPAWQAGPHRLGVHLAERLVAAMGGRLVPAAPGSAAKVTIELPDPGGRQQEGR
ncbi:MAG TPA: response regulator [Actinomycetota bacterium]